MRKINALIISMFVLATVGMYSCGEPEDVGPVLVTEVSLDKLSLPLEIGGTATLKATVKPDNATNQTVSWESSDDKVATVVDGLVTAIAEGEATVTVTTVEGGKTAQCVVTVATAVIGVESVTLNEESIEIFLGDAPFPLVATVNPPTATNPAISWSSDKPAVATVDAATGEVTALTAGTATITVTTEDGNKTARCEVKVSAPPVAEVTLDRSAMSFGVGGSGKLTATVWPEFATNKNVTWSSNDKSVATVENGVVNAIANGTTTITVTTAEGGFTAECKVLVSWLGAITFKTEEIWTIGDLTWSDYVMAEGNRGKTDYGSASAERDSEGRLIDSRENQDLQYSDFFSWGAVNKYQDYLCPDGWRVPEKDDFVALDIALGGNGENQQWNGDLIRAYDDTWGLERSGMLEELPPHDNKEVAGAYSTGSCWAISRDGNDKYFKLYVVSLYASPAMSEPADQGCNVRCVK